MKLIFAFFLLLASSANCYAENALETIAFLSLDIDKARVGSNSSSVFRDELNSSDEMLNYKLYGSGNAVLTDITITQPAECVFEIKGPRFNSDKIIQADYTIDFRGLLPQKPAMKKNLDENAIFASTVFYMVIPGVQVCSKGESFDFARENFPPAGRCTSSMETKYVLPGGNLDRQLAALEYLRKNFCKGRSF